MLAASANSAAVTTNTATFSLEGIAMPESPLGDEWQVIGVRPVYESKWVRLELAEVQLPSGRHFEHHKVTMPAAAMTVVLSDSGDDVLLSWRHRFVPDTWNYELPGGLVEDDEDPEVTAVREVVEETGYRPRSMRHLVTFEPMIGMVSSPHHLFLARGASRGGHPTEKDEGHFEWVPLARIPDLITSGKVVNSGTLVGLLQVLALRDADDPE